MAKKAFLFIFIFILFLLPSSALSLGISPGELGDYNFEPNLMIKKTVCISNSVKGYFEVEMVLRGNLTEYATLSQEHLILDPKGTLGAVKCLDLVLQLPERLEKPGMYKLWVWAGQVVGGVAGESMLGGRVEVGTNLKVHLAYPGKYVEADMEIESGEVNETVTFTIKAINRGNQTIESAQGTIAIRDKEGRKVATVLTDTKSMEPSVWTELEAEWVADVEPGEYAADAVISYDGQEASLSGNFRVGSPTAKILEVETEPIVNGTVGTVKTTVISYWSQEIENAHVSLVVSRGGYSGSSLSASKTLKPWETTEFSNFWDTSEAIGPGEYQGKVTLHYLGKTDSREVKLEVTEEVFMFPDLIWVAVIALVVIFLVMFLFTLRKRDFVQKKLT